jgi:hypothetical protein
MGPGPKHSHPIARFGLCLVALSAVGASGCGGDDDPPSVLVVGDSITNLTEDSLRERDENRHRFIVRAEDGATSKEMLEVIEADDLGGAGHEQVIINLGTNDVRQELTGDETESTIEELIGRFGDADCIHLTTINEQVLVPDDPDVPQRNAEINDRLRSIVEREERVHLIDWNARVAAHRDRSEDEGSLLEADMVHPTEQGQDELGDLYLEALGRCDGSGNAASG